MRSVAPEVFLVARPKVDYDAMAAYLREVGGERWLERIDRGQLEAQDLAGRRVQAVIAPRGELSGQPGQQKKGGQGQDEDNENLDQQRRAS